MAQETLLSVKNLSHSFDGHKAIENINFEIRRGEVVALLGVNGAGKSTTLNIITGNLNPDKGDVCICDHNVFKQPKSAKYNLGYLPEIPPLYRELTVYEYLQFAARIHGVAKHELENKIQSILKICGLTSVEKKINRKFIERF